MYLKRLFAFLCSIAFVLCLVPATAFAEGGNGNIDGGGGGMGQGTSSNFWNPGNDGVRITVVDAESGSAVSSPLDFSNKSQKSSVLHFGKVNKLQYLGGKGLSLQSGVAYTCIKPAQSMPTIVSSKGQNNIDAIKRYFCSEYACKMVAQAAGVDYEKMVAGDYKLLIEPIAYFTHNGLYLKAVRDYCSHSFDGQYTFSTIALRQMRFGLYDYLRTQSCQKRRAEIISIQLEPYSGSRSLEELLSVQEDIPMQDLEMSLLLHDLAGRISQQQMNIVRLKRNGYGIREISSREKIPMKRIKEILEEVRIVFLEMCRE